jgi:hypothetical protein
MASTYAASGLIDFVSVVGGTAIVPPDRRT